MPRPFQTLSSRIAWACHWYRVRQDRILLPNGQEGEYNIVEKEPAVWVLPVTAEKDVVLIRSYRYTVDDWCWEIPAGGIKPDQTPEQAAKAELREEIGGSAEMWHFLGQSYIANGICNEVGHFYLATGVTLTEPQHEAAEVIEIHRVPIAEALRMARANEISDAPSALVILLAADRLSAL